MALAIYRTKLVAPSGQGVHLAVLPDLGAQPTSYTNSASWSTALGKEAHLQCCSNAEYSLYTRKPGQKTWAAMEPILQSLFVQGAKPSALPIVEHNISPHVIREPGQWLWAGSEHSL